jgi:hypothetical protein
MKNIKNINEINRKNISENDIIILNPLDSYFNQDLKLAFHYGFGNPIIRSEKYIKNPYVFLSKKQSQKSYDKFLKNIDFALKHYHSSDKICNHYIILNDNAIKFLEYHTKTHKFKLKNGNLEQREISGVFDMYPISDNMLEINIDKVDTGELENANHTNTLASFHTHPLDAYVKYNVCMAYPSADDYFTTLHIYASGYGAFHITSTVEGLYIITIKKTFMNTDRKHILENFESYKEDIEDKYGMDYPICDPNKDNTSFWKRRIKNYLKKINKLKYFNVQFVFWKDAHKPIKISYNKINKNCLISDHQVNINKNIT